MEQSYLWGVLATSLSKTNWTVNTTQNSDKTGDLTSDFQKMLDQKSQTAKPANPAKETATSQKENGTPVKEEAVPEEDPQDMVRKLAEAGMVPVQVVNLVDAETVAAPLEENAGGEELAVSLMGGEVGAELTAQTETAVTQEQTQDVDLSETVEVAEETPAQAEVQTIQDAPTVKAEEQVEVKPQTEAAVEVETEGGQTEEVEVTDAETAPQPVFQDVKAAPIKVGEAPAAEENQQAGDVGEQIAGPLANALAQGETRVEIKLTPDSLGTVTIEITHSQDGGLHVALSAENNQTRGLLERHAANLQGLLGRQGQEHVQVEVQHNSESQEQHNDQYDGHNGHNGQQPREHRQNDRQEHETHDFLQQLRLGLIPMEE